MSDDLIKRSNIIKAYVEPKQGEWKDGYDASRICGVKLKVCSVCGKEYNCDLAKRFNFCPTCGAKMKGTNNEYDR